MANLAVPVVGFVLASRRPANRLGWLFVVAGLGLGLGSFARAYGLHALVAAPGSWPAGRAACLARQLDLGDPLRHARLPVPALPDRAAALEAVAPGRVVRRRSFTLTTVGLLVNASRLWLDPFGATSPPGIPPLLLAVLIILMLAALVVSVAAVVVRFARSWARSGCS